MFKRLIYLVSIVAGMACVGMAEVAVDLTFSPVLGTNVSPARPLDVNTTNEATYAWSDTSPLFAGDAASGQYIYGAYTVTGSNSVAGADLQIQDPAGEANDFIYFYGLNSTTTTVNSFVAFALWDSADFLQSGLDSFDTRVDSALTAGIKSFIGSDGLRFVIRAGGEMFVSSLEYSGSAVLRGTDIENGLEWATFSTNDWSLFTSSAPDLGMGVTNFAQKIFTNNITGVGFIANGQRLGSASAVLRIDEFKAELVTEPQDPVVVVDTAVVVDLDQGSFSNNVVERVPDVFNTPNEITYDFSATNALFIEPGSNAVPIYGGYSAVGAGTVGTNTYLLLNAGGYIETRGMKAVSGTMDARALLFWDSADFLQPDYNMFGSTFESQISINVKALTNAKGVNAVIRDGDAYYISQQIIKSSGILTVSGLDAMWAPFDPANFQAYDSGNAATFGVATNAFEAHVFTNVTGVGLIGWASRASGNPTIIEINDVVASLQRNEGVITTPYDDWAALWLPADVSDPAGDNDNDLLTNLGEYALNGNPTNSSDRGMTESLIDGSMFKYVHAQLVNDTNVIYRLIDSLDLVFNGSAATNNWDSQSMGPVSGDYRMVTNGYNTVESAKFIELEIEQQ